MAFSLLALALSCAFVEVTTQKANAKTDKNNLVFILLNFRLYGKLI
jgi:hypothetical protein